MSLLSASEKARQDIERRNREDAQRISGGVLDSFTEAFGGGGGCRGQCACGVVFYDIENNWDWESGELDELERLRSDGKAKSLPHGVGYIEFEGAQYVWDCDCWKPRAGRIVAFIDGHAEEIAKFLNLERARKIREIERVQVVETIVTAKALSERSPRPATNETR